MTLGGRSPQTVSDPALRTGISVSDLPVDSMRV